MANLFIGGIEPELLKQLKRKAIDDGITLKQLVVPLEMAVNSRPMIHISEVAE